MNKLSLCVNPWRTILLHVEQLTGLNNDNLAKQGRFDSDLVACLTPFLTRLYPPVCLVAHNGDKFDFPLLLAELFNANGSPIDGLFCCDSLQGARHIFDKQRFSEEQAGIPHPIDSRGEVNC